MKIERHLQPREGLNAFAHAHDLTMAVRERGVFRGALPKFYARFKHVEVMKQPGFLISISGNGETEQEATADYTRRISGTLLVVDAMLESRREIRAPILEFDQETS